MSTTSSKQPVVPVGDSKIHCDPTGAVNFQQPRSVARAIDDILRTRYGAEYGQPLLDAAITDLVRAFKGDFPACCAVIRTTMTCVMHWMPGWPWRG